MIRAYDKVYLEKARVSLGRMLDFAVYDLKYDLEEFFGLFLSSGVASLFGEGDYRLIAGMSGVELAYEVLERSGRDATRIKPAYTATRSEEYWLGWAIAYYQWHTARSFSEIVRYVPLRDIIALYNPYHEMDIRHFVDIMNCMYSKAKPETNLKVMRNAAGLSQSALSELSGVPIRTLQQYEQRQKNINKAQAEYLVKISSVLCCDIRDLLEYDTRD